MSVIRGLGYTGELVRGIRAWNKDRGLKGATSCWLWTSRWLVIPTLHALTASDPELGHRFAIKALELPLRPKDHAPDDEILSFEVSVYEDLAM